MKKAKIVTDKYFITGPVDPRIFGSFIEHLGRAVYGGIYQPEQASAGSGGFRRDVINLVRELNVPAVRYPGGNFVSGYNWEDGVGPREKRPARLELAWGVTEDNSFGLNEFVSWCREAASEPMMAINLGTRGVSEAKILWNTAITPAERIFPTCGVRTGTNSRIILSFGVLETKWTARGRSAIKRRPNTPRTAHESAKVMKWVDPSIELVALRKLRSGHADIR